MVGSGCVPKQQGFTTCCLFLWSSVSVESAMQSHDVSMTCFCAVSLSSTRGSAVSVLLEETALGRCCATPCRHPSAASVTVSLLIAVKPVVALLGAQASGRHALHGETLLCGSHHVVRRHVACGAWICHQVGHVRQCAMWQNVLTCDTFHNKGIFDQKGSKFVVFQPNFESSFHLKRQIVCQMNSRCPERREKREVEISGAQGEPATPRWWTREPSSSRHKGRATGLLLMTGRPTG